MVRLATLGILLLASSSGCSVLAPSDDELGGGRRDGGSGSQDAGSVPKCSGALVDAFDGPALGNGWNVSTQGGASVEPSNSGLRIVPGQQGSSAYIASQNFAFRNCGVTVHVAEFPNTNALSYLFWNVQDPSGTLPQFYAQQGVGLAQRVDGGEAAFSYTDGDDIWLRLRESQGTLYYDTSPNGGNWTNLTSEPTPVADPVSTALGAGALQDNNQAPGIAVFTSFNQPPGG